MPPPPPAVISLETVAVSPATGTAEAGAVLKAPESTIPLPPPTSTAEATPPLPPVESAATSTELETPQYCRIIYNTYQQPFPLKSGSLTAVEIDEEYCFSVVMPGCTVRLSQQGPSEFTRLAQKRVSSMNVPPSPFGEVNPWASEFTYVKEEPSGTFVGLIPGVDYYAYVEEAPERRDADEVFKAAQFLKLSDANDVDIAKNPPTKAVHEADGEYADFDQQYAEFADLQDTWGGPPEQAPGEESSESSSSGSSMAAGITGGGGITVGAAGWR
jgi:hypothetical protein